MSAIVLNNPGDLPWQTVLFDALMTVMFISIVVYSVVRWRRGTRIWGAVLTAAIVYGLILELAGMATLDMYEQGRFPVMINWPALSLFEGTTQMPTYVIVFYPVMLFTGFCVVRASGIAKDWQAAMAGGLFMIALDAPYIIEGNLRHVVWWTWDTDFSMFQFWLGWPFVDLFWQATWDSLFFYLMLRALPMIDGASSTRLGSRRVLGVLAPTRALIVLILGPVLFLPLIAVTVLVGPQWPVVILLVAVLAAVTVAALRTARPPLARVEPMTRWVVGGYVAVFAAITAGNVVHERGLTAYIVVQMLGLVVVSGFVMLPVILRRRNGGALVDAADGSASGTPDASTDPVPTAR